MNQALENEILRRVLDNPPMKRGETVISPRSGWLVTASHHVMTTEMIPRFGPSYSSPSSPEAPSVEPLAATSAAQLPWDLHTAVWQSWESPTLLIAFKARIFALQQWVYQLPALQNTLRARLPCENIISGLFVLTELGFERQKVEVLELIIVT